MRAKSLKSHVIIRETKILNLIHSGLGDIKHIITRGCKRFYLILVNDDSRFIELYL
jgi:hypothetical protein